MMIAEIVSLPAYESLVTALLNEEERAAMEFFIACAPEDHPVIPGSGGFRKARWAGYGRGKSGGFRVIYFFIPEPSSSHSRPDLHGIDLREVTKGRAFGGRFGMRWQRLPR